MAEMIFWASALNISQKILQDSQYSEREWHHPKTEGCVEKVKAH
jgi:hypothetical protein